MGCETCPYFIQGAIKTREAEIGGWIETQRKSGATLINRAWQGDQIVLNFPLEIRVPELRLEFDFPCSRKGCEAQGKANFYYYLRKEFLNLRWISAGCIRSTTG